MSVSLMPPVEKLSIDAVQLLSHSEGKVPVRCLDQKMVMVCHEAVGMAHPVITFIDVLKGAEEVLVVLIVLEDGLLFVAARGNMIHGAGVFYAKRSGHGANVACPM